MNNLITSVRGRYGLSGLAVTRYCNLQTASQLFKLFRVPIFHAAQAVCCAAFPTAGRFYLPAFTTTV